jgi:hypothetical protein
MSLTHLHIEFNHDFELKFRLLESPITDLWIERMQSRGDYQLDHPDRFYSFNTHQEEVARAESMIGRCINTINQYQKIIDRPFTNVYDQDTLNYLHNIFERYHGMLDQQEHDFWNNAPDTVRTALADLNLCVHRCESVARTHEPRFVCTWYGMPKTKTLPVEQVIEHASLHTKFGTVYLNYAEIGKTLEDLATDNDRYIADNMFQPFDHYSADFSVRLYNTTQQEVDLNLIKIKQYFEQHQEFFQQHGYTDYQHPRLLPYNFPVAELETDLAPEAVLAQIAARQLVTQVYIK